MQNSILPIDCYSQLFFNPTPSWEAMQKMACTCHHLNDTIIEFVRKCLLTEIENSTKSLNSNYLIEKPFFINLESSRSLIFMKIVKFVSESKCLCPLDGDTKAIVSKFKEYCYAHKPEQALELLTFAQEYYCKEYTRMIAQIVSCLTYDSQKAGNWEEQTKLLNALNDSKIEEIIKIRIFLEKLDELPKLVEKIKSEQVQNKYLANLFCSLSDSYLISCIQQLTEGPLKNFCLAQLLIAEEKISQAIEFFEKFEDPFRKSLCVRKVIELILSKGDYQQIYVAIKLLEKIDDIVQKSLCIGTIVDFLLERRIYTEASILIKKMDNDELEKQDFFCQIKSNVEFIETKIAALKLGKYSEEDEQNLSYAKKSFENLEIFCAFKSATKICHRELRYNFVTELFIDLIKIIEQKENIDMFELGILSQKYFYRDLEDAMKFYDLIKREKYIVCILEKIGYGKDSIFKVTH